MLSFAAKHGICFVFCPLSSLTPPHTEYPRTRKQKRSHSDFRVWHPVSQQLSGVVRDSFSPVCCSCPLLLLPLLCLPPVHSRLVLITPQAHNGTLLEQPASATMEGTQSREELEANLAEYKAQLQQARAGGQCHARLHRLHACPRPTHGSQDTLALTLQVEELLVLGEHVNEEMNDMYSSLTEVGGLRLAHKRVLGQCHTLAHATHASQHHP